MDQVEIIEFVSTQLSCGALPSDQEIINNVQTVAISLDNERSDRAWLALLQRPQTRGDPEAQLSLATGRPRVCWHLHWLLKQYSQAIEQFLLIASPTERDKDELFERIHSHLLEDKDITYLENYLPAITDYQPRIVAAILIENRPELIPSVLEKVTSDSALEFGECLLERGRLNDEAALIYFRHLCLQKPSEVENFLKANGGIIRPEDALKTVREAGPKTAEPYCLENAGDPQAALNLLIESLSSCDDSETRSRTLKAACKLCIRVAPTVPADDAAEMWSRLLRYGDDLRATMLLDAIAYLPVDSLIGNACDSVEAAATVLECAASRLTLWRCAMRILDRELHQALFRALHVSGRGVRVRHARCARCGDSLATRAECRICPCGGALHSDCQLELKCQACFVTPSSVYHISRQHTPRSLPPLQHNLSLVAPPRPDLEGIV